jgi:hypothetical protein
MDGSHIAHDHVELKGISWCGRDFNAVGGMEWWFVDIDHAAESGRQRSLVVACPKCVAAIVKALRNGHDPIDARVVGHDDRP